MPKHSPRHVFFISESTGITAETFGNSLLSQFPDIQFERHYLPFTNTHDKAETLVNEITRISQESGDMPLVFATMPDPEIDAMITAAPCHYYEIFERFLQNLGENLGVDPVRSSGMSHGQIDHHSYETRIDTVNYTLNHDDAISLKSLEESDIILIGVSRSGKTPTCLYLAIHYGLKAANYPLTDDDFEESKLPAPLAANREKLVAITIDPQRLHQIREKRRPGSHYSSLETCRREVAQANKIFRRYQLPILETTSSSIEELSARIVKNRNLHPS